MQQPRNVGDLSTSGGYTGQEAQRRAPQPPPKKVPVPSDVQSSGSSSLEGKRFNFTRRKSSSDVSGSEEGSKGTGNKSILKRRVDAGTASASSSPVVARSASKADSASQDALRLSLSRDSERASAETITPKGIRCFFAEKRSGLNRDTLDVALSHIHSMGRELSRVWYDPDREIGTFLSKMAEFRGSIMPQFVSEIYQRQFADREEIPQEDAKNPQAIRRVFAKKPVDIQAQERTRDLALYNLFTIGMELADVWRNPQRGMKGYEVKVKSFEDSIQPRFDSAIYQLQEIAAIQSPDDLIESAFLEGVEEILREKVLLDPKQAINSPSNRKILQQLHPEAGAILEEMDELVRANKQLINPEGKISRPVAAILKRFGFEFAEASQDRPVEASEKRMVKLNNDYAFLVCAYRLCEAYVAAIENICRGLKQPESSSMGIVNDIVKLGDQHIDSSEWADINSDPPTVKSDWLKKVHDRMTYRCLDVFKLGMMEKYRKLLVQNMSVRQCNRPLFDDLSKKLEQRLVSRKMQAVGDMNRPFTPRDQVRCYVNGNEVRAEQDIPIERFKAYLRTYGELFGHPEMFWFLAQKLGVPIPKGEGEVNASDAYTKLMSLDPSEKDKLKAFFVKEYDSANFEKVLKYFKLAFNVLDQQTLYYYVINLLRARAEKFELKRVTLGTKEGKAEPNNDKNKYTIRVDGSTCTIKVSRMEDVYMNQVFIKQEYSFSFDVDDDKIFTPKEEQVSITIECPRALAEHNPEISKFLRDLPLIAEAMGYPKLATRYT